MSSGSSQPTTDTQVAVVGGGIGGLAAAAFLRARGFDVAIFERQSWSQVQKSTHFGNGIHLYFHCARMLVGAGVPIREYLTPLDIQMRRDDGRLRTDITRRTQLRLSPELDVTRASVYSLLRQHLYKVLVAHTPRASLHCDKECVSATQRDDRVEVAFADGTSVVADLVVGADGIHSVLADQLFGPRLLHKHDIVILQGISTYDQLDPVETWVLHRRGGTMGLVPVILPSKRPGTFWWITMSVAELDGIDRSDIECWQAVSRRYPWDVIAPVVNTTDPASLERWYSQDKDPLRQWYRDRIVLLGDACHAATPFSGYGAGMAIEDGYWLARRLANADVLGRPAYLARALRAYQDKRAPFTARIVRDARILMHTLHPSSRVLGGVLNTVWNTGVLGALVARKFTALFRHGLADTEWTGSEQASGQLEV